MENIGMGRNAINVITPAKPARKNTKIVLLAKKAGS